MPPPAQMPIGLQLVRSAKVLSRAFDDALAAAGGTLATWLVMISLKSQRLGNQRELAEAIGIQGATLTHHLNAMEADGLVTRQRDPANRRIHRVELTERGETMFRQLRSAAAAFDRRVRAGISEQEVATLEGLLDQLRHNVDAS
jgi:MarR family transcriptional regulator for hemolysin